MRQRQVDNVEQCIIERARKVLPSGGFGNVTFDRGGPAFAGR